MRPSEEDTAAGDLGSPAARTDEEGRFSGKERAVGRLLGCPGTAQKTLSLLLEEPGDLF